MEKYTIYAWWNEKQHCYSVGPNFKTSWGDFIVRSEAEEYAKAEAIRARYMGDDVTLKILWKN